VVVLRSSGVVAPVDALNVAAPLNVSEPMVSVLLLPLP
jgi:hypothetical protein